MKQFARAIVIHENKLLVMNRNKVGQIYSTLVGGEVDPGETPEQAVLREIDEETGLVVNNPRLVIVEKTGEKYGDQYVFLCEFVSGFPKLSPNSVEYKLTQNGDNQYHPSWLPLSDLPSTIFLSTRLKTAILKFAKNGWPDKPLVLRTRS